MTVLPTPCLVVLVGPSGSGKSTWAAKHVPADQVLSSDRLRALVGEGEHDQRASTDAFVLLEMALDRRLARGLTTVVDTLGFNADDRARWRAKANAAGLTTVCVVFETPAALCRQQNRLRPKAVPVAVLDQQLKAFAALRGGLDVEGFDFVVSAKTETRLVPRSMASTAPLAVQQSVEPIGMKFGLQLPAFTWAGGPAEIAVRLRNIARTAEDVGFDSLWVMDHFRQIPLMGPKWADMLESYTTLGFLAAHTSRVRLGAMVTGITYRNIAHLGKIIATLDVLSGGRAMCGLGAAWFADEHQAYGWPFPSAKARLDLLEDALQLLPMLWGPGTPAFHGKTVDVPEALCYPRPLQARIPILVGGSGEKRTLRLVARYADACNLFGDLDTVRRKLDVLGRHCDEVGRARNQIEVTHLSTTMVGTDGADVSRRIAAVRPSRMSAEKYARQNNAGTVEDQIGRFRGLADVGVQSAIISLPDVAEAGALERFAPIIAAFHR